MEYSDKATKQYQLLSEYAKKRTQEVSEIIGPYLEATDWYGKLLTRICLIVGESEPQSIRDSVLRDLLPDIFDFLYESRVFLSRGQILLAYPLARRAYESLSLMQWCSFDEKAADNWNPGTRFTNSQVRKALANHPMGENEDELKKLYNYFCGLTHTNRELIAYRGLGEGNCFVFGSVSVPNLVELVDFCLKSLELGFWFCPVATWSFRELILEKDKAFFTDHNELREEVINLRKWLIQQRKTVFKEWINDEGIIRPKYS